MKVADTTGYIGERIASDYLKKNGYKIIEYNYRKRYGEIDIIALEVKNIPTLVFVEVKTRRNAKYGSPFEAISKRKLSEITKTAAYYKMTHHNTPEALRIDALGIILKPDNSIDKIEHIKNLTF